MNPAEPVTRTFSIYLASLRACVRRSAMSSTASGAAEGEAVPAQVLRDPLAAAGSWTARGAVEPDRGHLGDGPARAARLRGQLEADLEAVARLDRHVADELGVVRLERVRRVAGADAGEQVQRPAGHPREEPLEARPADLLSAGHVARLPAATTTPRSTSSVSSSIWRGSSLPSAIVTTTVGAAAASNPVADRLRRPAAVGVHHAPDARVVCARARSTDGDRRVVGRCRRRRAARTGCVTVSTTRPRTGDDRPRPRCRRG